MEKRIKALTQHVIVCGYGRIGRTVCRELSERDHDVVVVEQDEAAFEEACADGFLAVSGSAVRDDVLDSAGLEVAEYLVACVDSELENIVITLGAHARRPELMIIARAEHADEVGKLERAGAAHTVSPFQSGGMAIASMISRKELAKLFGCSDEITGLTMTQVHVCDGSPLVDLSLAELGSEQASRLSFVALERGGKEPIVPPRGTVCLVAGDVLVVAGDAQQAEILKSLGTLGS